MVDVTTEMSVTNPAPSPAGPIVEINDLHITLSRGGRDVRAIRGVDLTIGAGEIIGLVGESGSGKSVLGLSLLGLLPTDPAPTVEGRASVCGVDMIAASAAERRQV